MEQLHKLRGKVERLPLVFINQALKLEYLNSGKL